MSFHLNLANSLLKRRCESFAQPYVYRSDGHICMIVPKKGSKRFISIKSTVIAANDQLEDIWAAVKNCKYIFCYDFDKLPIDTQQLIFNLQNKEIFIWATPQYIRDPYNFADNDYLYKIYIDKDTELSIVDNIKFQILPKNT